jgi:hypothetical protein
MVHERFKETLGTLPGHPAQRVAQAAPLFA